VTAAIERLGGLDILVTNSGGPDKIGFDDATLEQFDETYELVVKSVIAAIDAALPALKDGGGAITNIIAASVQQPDANHILANTVRPSIYGLAKSLSHEYADDGIRVNNVCPKKVGPATPRRETGRRISVDTPTNTTSRTGRPERNTSHKSFRAVPTASLRSSGRLSRTCPRTWRVTLPDTA